MIGTVLRVRYEVAGGLGSTPLFDVFSANDRLQNKDVCIRVLRTPFASEPEFVQKLTSVVQTLSTISQPNLERPLLVDSDGSTVFMVSELAKGTSLRDRLRKLGSLSVPVAVGTAVVICEALRALHVNRIAHGDIGAHNIIISVDGEAKLQLGGIWQAYSFSQNAGEAVLPQMAPYLAPEISRGSMPNTRTDVYSLGVLLYEMLAGRLPYNSDTPAVFALKHVNDAVPNVRMLNPSVPVVLAEIVKKSMAKEPSMRYASASELMEDLVILQDALKFGKTLTWPIREESVQDPLPVAPKMSALRTEPVVDEEPPRLNSAKAEVRRERREKKVKEKYEGDVPVWLKYLIAILMTIVGVLIVGYLVYNVNKPKNIRVPDTRRLTVSEATSRLTDLGLNVYISKRKTSSSVPAEHVISTWPEPGEMSKERSKVGLIVSIGSEMVQVPKLVGSTLTQAQEMLASLDLKVAEPIEEIATNKFKVGTIVSQDPAPGTNVSRTTSVHVQLAKSGKPIEGSNQKYVYEIDFPVTGTTEEVQVKIEMVDARGTREIYNQRHLPEDQVNFRAEGFGEQVRLIVYYDGTQVAEKVVRAADVVQESE